MAKEKRTKRAPAGKRREAIIEAALELFLKKGYAAVSVDEIIGRSGGSKSSVYEYFGTKEGLFREIVTSMAEKIMTKAVEIPETEGLGPREILTNIGISACSQILNDRGIGLYRLAVASSTRAPKVSRVFYEAGPLTSQRSIAEYLGKEAAAGRLNIKDPGRAAEFFLGMILVRHHIAMPLGCAKPPTKSEIKKMVGDAVEVFMAAYGK